MTTNQQIHLASRPVVEATIPELQPGQVLVRHHFMSLDPCMRGRMNDAKSCAAPQPLIVVMQGGRAAATEAFLGLLKGRNFGKQVVKLV